MTTETKQQWSPEVLRKYQEILDRSAKTASKVMATTFGRDDWRFDAQTFLDTWNGVRMCTVGSASVSGAPHLAVIHSSFKDDGRLIMRMFEQSVRQKDFRENPKVALSKHSDDGAVMTIYGKPREVPDTYAPPRGGGDGPGTIEVEIEVTRMYGMRPQR